MLSVLLRKSGEIKDVTWEKVNRQYGRGHKNLLSVVDLLLTLPASSAEVERGFSQLKLLKTDMRSKLKESHLNDLMFIKLLSAPIPEFDPTEAIRLWNTSGILPRRPHFKERNKPKRKATGAICAQVVQIRSDNVGETVPAAARAAAELVGRDDRGDTEAVDSDISEAEPELEHVSRAADVDGDVVSIGKAEENVDVHVVDTACDSHSDDSDSGVEDADLYSDIDEREVDSLINKYL